MATASDSLPALLVALALCAGCDTEASSRAPVAEAPTEPEQVGGVVRELITSMHGHDCARVDALVDGALRERFARGGGCRGVVEHDPESMSLELIRMDEPRRDGRDATAWIVPVVLRGAHQEQTALMRVQRRGGQLRVVAM